MVKVTCYEISLSEIFSNFAALLILACSLLENTSKLVALLSIFIEFWKIFGFGQSVGEAISSGPIFAQIVKAHTVIFEFFRAELCYLYQV